MEIVTALTRRLLLAPSSGDNVYRATAALPSDSYVSELPPESCSLLELIEEQIRLVESVHIQ